MEDPLDKVLAHHGIKGMKWGVRRRSASVSSGPPTPVLVKATPGHKVATVGGHNQGPHPDAIATATTKQKARSSTTDSLATHELQALVTRMNLEAQYAKLSAVQQHKSPGRQFIEELIANEGKSVLLRGKKGPIASGLEAVINSHPARHAKK